MGGRAPGSGKSICEGQELGKNLARERDVEGYRRSRAEIGQLQPSRREMRVIRLGWRQRRFGAVARAETYVGDGTHISCWCFGHERQKQGSSLLSGLSHWNEGGLIY